MSDALDIETLPIGSLSDADRLAWMQIRASNEALESPYHHLDYHQLVDDCQGGVMVTLARREDRAIAFLPWQGGAFARASGAPLSDYQAVISNDPNIDVATLLAKQPPGAFHYTAFPEADGESTARIELTDAESWRAEQGGSYRRHLKSNRRRTRKAEEEIGSPRIVTQSRDIDAYNALMAWKRQKFEDTGKFDVLANNGTAGLLRTLWERGSSASLRADLHTLYFGDRLAAADLGLTDGRVFHSWIVGYDPDLLTYGPGIQLLEGVIDQAAQVGYRVIDLGPGLDGYKRHYASHARQVSAGVVTLPSAAGLIAASYDRLEDALANRTNDSLGKLRRRYSQIAACEPQMRDRTKALISAFRTHLAAPKHPSAAENSG